MIGYCFFLNKVFRYGGFMPNSKTRLGELTRLTVAVLLALLLLASSLVSCSYTPQGERLDFNAMTAEELAEYIEIGQYKGMEISLAGRSKGDAVWAAVADGAKVKGYPEGHFYYYKEQLEAQYKYYAEEAGVSYGDMLAELGENEESIIKKAKEMTKRDILYSTVVKLEGISLSEQEKQTHFARYVAKYVSEYGYTEEYVTENMTELIYDSMLYDKTTEFLIINNTFVE